MNQPRFRPRVVRPRSSAPAPDFSAFQDTPTAEAAQRAAIEQARLNAGVEVSPSPPIQLEAVRMPRITLPRPAQSQEPFGGQSFVQLDPVLAGRSQAALAQAMAENRLTPEYQAQQAQLASARRAAAPPSDATADELRELGYDEQSVSALASDAHDAPGARVAPSAADAVRHLSAMTPALPEPPVAHQRPAPVVRRGAMDIPAMPSTAPSLDEGYAVRDGQLIPRAQPMQIPEGYAVTQDGQVLPRAEPIPMSFVPTEQGGPNMSEGAPLPEVVAGAPSYEHTIEAGAPQFDPPTVDAGPVQMETTGTVEIGAPQNIRSLAPRVGVPRRRTAPYVAGLPNAPGGTAEMPSALQPPTAWPARPAVARRTPLDTQMDTLDLNVQYAMSRAEDAQDAGQRLADIEIARQRRLNETQMDRERAEGLARQNVQRAADRAAAIRIDPSRAMQGASGIANVIAVVLGGIGSGITGGPNQPLAMVQQNIERDLAAQRTDLDTARNAVADQQSILGNVRQEFQSREAADNAFREFALRQAAAETEVQAGRANYAEARDRANNLREQLVNAADQARAAAERAEMEQLLAFDRSRAETGYFDARARATLATASGTEATNARRALMAMRGRPAPGSVEAWDRMTPAQQAQALENHQSILLTGADAVTASRMSGVPIAAGERAPVENGARMATGTGAEAEVPFEQARALEQTRRITVRDALLESGSSREDAARISRSPIGNAPITPETRTRIASGMSDVRVLQNFFETQQANGGVGLEGIGWFDNNVPDSTLSREALDARMAFRGLEDTARRIASGAGGNENEVSQFAQIVRGDGTEVGAQAGVARMERVLGAMLENSAQPGSPTSFRDLIDPSEMGPAPTPAPASRPRLIAPPRAGSTAGPGSME